MVVDGDFFGGQGYPNLVPHALGSPRNSYAWSMAWFDGRLYVGTTRDVLCFQGADVSACELDEEASLVIGDDQRAEIWRYTPSVGDFGLSGTWERVFRSPQVGFPLNLFVPDLPRDFGYRGMTTCDAGGAERLYVTASGIPGHILYFDGLDFLPSSTAGLNASLARFHRRGSRPGLPLRGLLQGPPVDRAGGQRQRRRWESASRAADEPRPGRWRRLGDDPRHDIAPGARRSRQHRHLPARDRGGVSLPLGRKPRHGLRAVASRWKRLRRASRRLRAGLDQDHRQRRRVGPCRRSLASSWTTPARRWASSAINSTWARRSPGTSS